MVSGPPFKACDGIDMVRAHSGGPATLGLPGSKLKGGEDQGPNMLFKGTQESSKVHLLGPTTSSSTTDWGIKHFSTLVFEGQFVSKL